MADGGARELGLSLLEAELPRRWAHCVGVARQAAGIGHVLGGRSGLVEAAAWLHDIGYAAPLVSSGLHALDGARYLRECGYGDRPLWTLVAHHTGAVIEAEERGLADALTEEFPVTDVDPFAVTALTYCDLTTGPDGREISVEQRIAEILSRYSTEHVVHRSISRAAPQLRAQAEEVSALLGTA